MGPRLHLWFWAHVTAFLAQEYQDYMGSSPHLWFCACKTPTLGPEIQVSVGPRPYLWFFHVKHTFWTRITSPYGSQTWPVILCMYNSVLRISITSLHWSPPSSVDFDRKTTSFGTELQVSMCPRPPLSLCACKLSWLAPELQASVGPSPYL